MDEFSGRLSDLSEGGFAVDGAFPNFQRKVFSLALGLPDRSSPFRATAEIAWTNESRNRTGVHFVNIPASSRHQLRDWVTTHAAVPLSQRSPQYFAASEGTAQFNITAFRQQLTFGIDPSVVETDRLSARLRRRIGLCLTALAFCSAAIFLANHFGSWGDLRGTKTVRPPEMAPDLSAAAKADSVDPPPAKNMSLSPVSLDLPGFVLQVAAMAHEDNADRLSETLQQNNFPAFVFKRNSDRFYKVAVGSYADAESAAAIKRKLEEHGFKSILVRWSPE